jgi:hypothetical protein
MSAIRRTLALVIAAAVAVGGCARSEDADTKILRNDVDNVPELPSADRALDEAVPATGEAAIAAAIRADAAKSGGLGDNPRWVLARSDLDGDGDDEALAYVIDPQFCGTGGCTLYMLDEKDGAWVVVSKTGPSQLPVYRLDPGPDGWVALGVTTGGGGAAPAVMNVARDSNGYATNPTVPPAKPVEVAGREPLLADGEGLPIPAE